MVSVGSNVRALYSKLFSLSNYFLVGLVFKFLYLVLVGKLKFGLG